jgi:hypothetical protein
MKPKKQEKLTPMIFDDLWSRVRPKNLIVIYTKIKQENGAKTLHVGIILYGSSHKSSCIYQIYMSLFGTTQLTSLSCLETIIQEKIITERYVTDSLKGCNISDILEQP